DLPTENAASLALGAVTQRAEVHDVLISRHGLSLDALPQGARIGTSSRRRAAQLLAYRADLRFMDIRGNIGTRLEKALAADSAYDAIVLAKAGLARLGLETAITQVLPL